MPLYPIGDRLRQRREARGLSQESLARRMQTHGHETVTQQRISEMENDARSVSHDELINLARILRVRITDLLGVKDLAED